MTDLLDIALAKARGKPEPYVIGAPSIVPEPDQPMPLFDLTDAAIDAATLAERDAIIADLEKWGLLHLPFPRLAIRFRDQRVGKECGFHPWSDLDDLHLTMWFAGEPLRIETVYTTANLDLREHSTLPQTITTEQRDAGLKDGTINRRNVVTPEMMGAQILLERRKGSCMLDMTSEGERAQMDFETVGLEALTILLATLAARNVVKDVRYNSNNKTGDAPRYVSNGVTYLSRTVVRPPHVDQLETMRGGLSNGKLEIRLVRGHIRNVVADTTKPQPENVRVTVVGTGRTGRREQQIAPYYVNADAEFMKAPHYKVGS